MKCECECHCGDFSPREALDDRLYWVEILTGEYRGKKFAAWRDRPANTHPWVVSADGQPLRLSYRDDAIRIIHEITPE